jgi:hypothetical protein
MGVRPPQNLWDGLPSVSSPVDPPSAGGFGDLPALIAGTKALIETLRPAILLQHPEVETAVGIVSVAPRRNLCHEPRANAPPLVLGSDVEVIEQRSPSLVVSTVAAGKADQFVVLKSENDELIWRRRREPLLPDAEPLLDDITVEILVPIGPAIVSPPALGVQTGDRRCVRPGGFSKSHDRLAFSELHPYAAN